jgi:hypothetical protein
MTDMLPISPEMAGYQAMRIVLVRAVPACNGEKLAAVLSVPFATLSLIPLPACHMIVEFRQEWSCQRRWCC